MGASVAESTLCPVQSCELPYDRSQLPASTAGSGDKRSRRGHADALAEEICRTAKAAGAWLHVDGAFGLWTLACPKRAHLAKGVQSADSWATDGHKWLGVPRDSGIAFVREVTNKLETGLKSGKAK